MLLLVMVKLLLGLAEPLVSSRMARPPLAYRLLCVIVTLLGLPSKRSAALETSQWLPITLPSMVMLLALKARTALPFLSKVLLVIEMFVCWLAGSAVRPIAGWQRKLGSPRLL